MLYHPRFYSQGVKGLMTLMFLLNKKADFPAVEYLRFVLRLVLVPYYLIGKFTLRWFFLNYWIGGIILAYCTLMTVVECSKLKWLLLGGWR